MTKYSCIYQWYFVNICLEITCITLYLANFWFQSKGQSPVKGTGSRDKVLLCTEAFREPKQFKKKKLGSFFNNCLPSEKKYVPTWHLFERLEIKRWGCVSSHHDSGHLLFTRKVSASMVLWCATTFMTF